MTSIRKGTALLDRAYPEWFQAIDMNRLDLGSTYNCILGQLAQHEGIPYSVAPYHGMLAHFKIASDDAHEYGFNTPWGAAGEKMLTYRQLGNKWKRAIRRRMTKANA